MTLADQDLIGRIQKRDPEAFEELFTRHRQKLLRRLVRIVRQEAAAEDLLQEVFLRVWTRADEWCGRGTVAAWLFRIATNLALNSMRSARRRRQRPLVAPSAMTEDEEESFTPGWMEDPDALDPATMLEEAERYERLRKLIDGLTEEKREVLRLVYESEMDISSVADALGIPEGTVKSRLHVARKRLARKWEEMERRHT